MHTDGVLSSRQELRAGLTVEVPVTSSDPSVGEITASPVVFTGGGGSLASTQFDPLTAGETTIAIDHPTDFTVANNARTSLLATVTDE